MLYSITLYPLVTLDPLLHWSLLIVCSNWVTDQVSAGNVAVSVQIRHLAVHGLSHFSNQYDQYCFLKSVHCKILYSKGKYCMY